jgi:hypothetical protein
MIDQNLDQHIQDGHATQIRETHWDDGAGQYETAKIVEYADRYWLTWSVGQLVETPGPWWRPAELAVEQTARAEMFPTHLAAELAYEWAVRMRTGRQTPGYNGGRDWWGPFVWDRSDVPGVSTLVFTPTGRGAAVEQAVEQAAEQRPEW